MFIMSTHTMPLWKEHSRTHERFNFVNDCNNRQILKSRHYFPQHSSQDTQLTNDLFLFVTRVNATFRMTLWILSTMLTMSTTYDRTTQLLFCLCEMTKESSYNNKLFDHNKMCSCRSECQVLLEFQSNVNFVVLLLSIQTMSPLV